MLKIRQGHVLSFHNGRSIKNVKIGAKSCLPAKFWQKHVPPVKDKLDVLSQVKNISKHFKHLLSVKHTLSTSKIMIKICVVGQNYVTLV